MNTLLINANCCDVQIIEIICKTIVLMTIIIAIFYFFVQLSRIVLDWKKTKLVTNKDTKTEKDKSSDSKEEVEWKLGLQKQDRAKAIVKDFFETTKDKDTTENLIKMYKDLMGYKNM